MDNIEKLRQLRIEAWQIRYHEWIQGVFTVRWWVIAVMILALYIIWIKFSDKRRLIELLLFGSLIAVVRVIYDDWGISSGRWAYPLDLFPLGYSLFLNDLTVVPLSYMLVYQYSPTWKSFLLLSFIIQSIISFIFLPVLTSLGILLVYKWSYLYTFIFMLVTANLLRFIIVLLMKIQKQPVH